MVIGNMFFQSLCLMKATKPSASNRFFLHNCLEYNPKLLTLDNSFGCPMNVNHIYLLYFYSYIIRSFSKGEPI